MNKTKLEVANYLQKKIDNYNCFLGKLKKMHDMVAKDKNFITVETFRHSLTFKFDDNSSFFTTKKFTDFLVQLESALATESKEYKARFRKL